MLAPFAARGLSTLVQVGFALAFEVLLDTFVVRPFLVPAFAVLVWRRQEEQPDDPWREEPLPRPTRRAGFVSETVPVAKMAGLLQKCHSTRC
jgi:uncharacterized membrane protein YdfJ with MMPL/SSD domain